MDLRRFGVLIVLCLAAVGCRKDPYMDAYFELLNSEKRVLEDRLYELEYDYQKALKELEEYRASQKEEAEDPLQPEPDRESSRQRDDDTDDGMQLDIPDIELPPGFESGHKQTPGDTVFRTASAVEPHSRPAERLGGRNLSDQELAAAVVAALDQEVSHVVINARNTGGADFDDRPGDDGLTVLIEPRNKQGHFVAAPGALTVVLLDPALAGQSARVAKWEIDEDAARRAMRFGTLDCGMSFRLPWSGDRPEHNRLNLYVRYHGTEGTTLEAEREVRVQPTERVAQLWTPRPPRTPERRRESEMAVAWQTTETPTEPTVVQAVAQEEVSPSSTSRSAPAADEAVSPAVGRFWKPQR